MSLIRLVKPAFVAASLAGLTACAAEPTPYAPQSADRLVGYSDTQLTATRYRVSFAGNAQTDRETVENYLLFRAAEVTQAAGYRWFMFDTRDTSAKTTYLTSFTGGPGWEPRGWYWHSWGWGHRFGAPFPEEETIVAATRYRAYAEIVLLSDEDAKKEPRALSAAEIIAHVGPLVKRPQAN